MGGLLDLPTELLLQISAHLFGDAKKTRRVRHLRNLALTCRQLAFIVQDVLCLSPTLQSSKVDSLLLFLFNHPNLAAKIKNLTIETRETQNGESHPKHIAHLDPELLDYCKRHVRKLPTHKCIRDNMVALLKHERFEDHSVLIAVLLTLLPNLERLYLGGSILLNFPFLHTLFPVPSTTTTSTSAWPDKTDYTWLIPLIGPQLTSLELPLDLRPSVEAPFWTPLSIRALPTHFPNLQWLSVPHMAATKTPHTKCVDIIPPRLETLILTDARCGCFEVFSRGLLSSRPSSTTSCTSSFSGNGNDIKQTSLFPRLKKVQIYHRYETEPTGIHVVERLKKAGIQLSDYVPECCLRSGDEFFHPWKYTPEEITAREDARHERYATGW